MRKSKKQGFSLVEVVLALGVVAFAFVAILGLIPAGMSSFRQAINISVCTQIGQKVIGDAFEADYDTLMTPLGQTADSSQPFLMNYRYFDEEGNEIILPPALAPTSNTSNRNPTEPYVYLVITRVVPDITLPGVAASTPALPLTATITVQVVFDPGMYSPSGADFASNLLLASTTTNPPISPNIQASNVLTYYAHITRN